MAAPHIYFRRATHRYLRYYSSSLCERMPCQPPLPSRIAYFSTVRRGQKVFASAKASSASSRSCASTVSHVG